MSDHQQQIASQIMYDAMIVLRMINPGRYNRLIGSSWPDVSKLLALNSAIGDGLHNIPEIMVADMNEDERCAALCREYRIFMDTITDMDLPNGMPPAWDRLISRLRDALQPMVS